MTSKTASQYIKERNARFNEKHPNYRAYDYLRKKLKIEIDELPTTLKEKYDILPYLQKYELLKSVNSSIKAVGKENIGSFLQSVLQQHFF
jgi:hypothetical protein